MFASSNSWADEPSICYGTTSAGSLENGWKLPSSGANFSAYSQIGRILGRTYVHSTVYAVIVEAYSEAEKSRPGTVFVYGETGKEGGGDFDPHKTHRNGLSADFMVPVLNENGDSVALPTSVWNKWGYDHEFDTSGKLGVIRIDFEALAEHIYQLHRAAQNNGVDIWRVILDPDLQPHLRGSNRWPYLEEHVKFSTKRSWVRHDEHYHVDFDLPCEPAA